MNARIFNLFVLIVSLVLMSSASGAAAQQPSPSLPFYQGEVGEVVAAQQQARSVRLVGQIGGTTAAVAVQGNYAYVGDGPRLVILDVSNPTLPVVVGQTGVLPGLVEGVALAGNYAYVADAGSGLRIIDVSNQSDPSEVGFYDTSGSALGVALAGNFAYVADYTGGLRIIDVSDPAAPSEVGFYDTPGEAWGVALVGNYAYVADRDGGLIILSYLPYQVYLPLTQRN